MKKMKVLLLGSGGREHTIAWKLAQSTLLDTLYIAPGNAGTSVLGKNISLNINDFSQIRSFVLNENINMLVVGPEEPLVLGIHDYFLADEMLRSIPVIGPCQYGATLEGSKDFAKQFMVKHKIPTARYRSFTENTIQEAFEFLHELQAPYVLKADGLAAGKGVVIVNSITEAEQELKEMLLSQKFGKASSVVVIEEFLEGIEVSVFVLTDGNNYILLPEAKDYKRIGENNTGANTGGMGSISPVPFFDYSFRQKVINTIIEPTIQGLKADNIPYQGFIFFGLINVKGNPYVIEYNVRMGDPETESVIPRIKNDLLEIFVALAQGNISDIVLEIDKRTTASVMMVSGGYPENYAKGKPIQGLGRDFHSLVFHAGTAIVDGNIVTSGGRVLAVTSYGDNISSALTNSYQTIADISFEDAAYRKDIGFDFM